VQSGVRGLHQGALMRPRPRQVFESERPASIEEGGADLFRRPKEMGRPARGDKPRGCARNRRGQKIETRCFEEEVQAQRQAR
jgi:hypothetical protein